MINYLKKMEKHKKINESITTSISGFSEFSDHDEDFIQVKTE